MIPCKTALSLAAFALLALVPVAHVSACHSPPVGGGAAVCPGGRAAWSPACASGQPHLWTGGWLVATFGLVTMLVGAVTP